jgi:hypothetical protein
MEIFFLLAVAFWCASLAKKRGRGPIKWFFLGLFFNIFALLAVLLMGQSRNSSRMGASFDQGPASRFQVPNGFRSPPLSPQSGHVDLNSLREVVRRNSHSAGSGEASFGTPLGIDDEKSEFWRHLNELSHSLYFRDVPSETNDALKQIWLRLGQSLMDSGLSGGVNEEYEFYVVVDDETIAFFGPTSLDGTLNTLNVLFSSPLKRYANVPHGLREWVSTQGNSQSVEPLLIDADGSYDTVLFAATFVDPWQVTGVSLGGYCNSLAVGAHRIKQAVPRKFGGIVITFD